VSIPAPFSTPREINLLTKFVHLFPCRRFACIMDSIGR
jgi:hypothetical protein